MDIDPSSSVLFEDMEKPDFSVSWSLVWKSPAPESPHDFLCAPSFCRLPLNVPPSHPP